MGEAVFLRLRQIALVSSDLDPIVGHLDAVLGMKVAFNDPGVITFGLRNAVLPCDTTFLEIVTPVKEGTTAGRYLDRRNGDGGYMVILQVSEHGPVKERVDRLGIRKVVDVFEKEHDYAIMQLHPRDTGGSFLEIDVQGGGEDLLGPWMPAGGNWQAARDDEIVRGIVAAEIQSDEPASLAARWAEILDRAVVSGTGDVPTIELDNATLRFVQATDGRGEGLGGIDVRVTDVDRVRRAAEARGLLVDDNVLSLAGMRIRLVPA